MKNVLFFIVLFCLFSSAIVFASKDSWQEDLDGDGISENLTIYYEHAAQNIWKRLSIRRDGIEIFPQETKVSFSEFLIIRDIDPGVSGKEIITFGKLLSQNSAKAFFFAHFFCLKNGRYELYNYDRTDKIYRVQYSFGNKAEEAEARRVTPDLILAEFRRGTKFQRALRVAESFIFALKNKDFKRARELCSQDMKNYIDYLQKNPKKLSYFKAATMGYHHFGTPDEFPNEEKYKSVRKYFFVAYPITIGVSTKFYVSQIMIEGTE